MNRSKVFQQKKGKGDNGPEGNCCQSIVRSSYAFWSQPSVQSIGGLCALTDSGENLTSLNLTAADLTLARHKHPATHLPFPSSISGQRRHILVHFVNYNMKGSEHKERENIFPSPTTSTRLD